jgi:hypothetical protein
MIEPNEVSRAMSAAAVLAGRGSAVTVAMSKGISYRMPIWLLAKVDGLATNGNVSRNQVLNLVIEAGLDNQV